MSDHKDNIYQRPHSRLGKFQFDQRVAAVFSDMIERSVPGYQQILGLLPTLTRQFQRKGSNYYDLGCSLGAGMLAIAEGLESPSKLIGIDNSSAMLERATPILATLEEHQCELLCEDLCNSNITNAAMVLMNFTLQFIKPSEREALIRSIYQGLEPGGVLVLSEKVDFKDTLTRDTLTRIHHQYKADQGYSELEIAQKRDAIEDVLIPETLSDHRNRLKTAGFSTVVPWIQNLQFISILAIK